MHIWDYNSLLPQMCDVELFSSFMNNAVAHCSKIQFVVHLIKFFKMQIVISILALKFKSFQFDLSTHVFAEKFKRSKTDFAENREELYRHTGIR